MLIQIAERIGYCYEIETFALAPCGSSIGNACGALKMLPHFITE